jgi:hypothetical protein
MISVGGLDDATVLVGEFDESLDRSWRRRDLLLDRNVFRGRRAKIAELRPSNEPTTLLYDCTAPSSRLRRSSRYPVIVATRL